LDENKFWKIVAEQNKTCTLYQINLFNKRGHFGDKIMEQHVP
jgi:hypothetical protein